MLSKIIGIETDYCAEYDNCREWRTTRQEEMEKKIFPIYAEEK